MDTKILKVCGFKSGQSISAETNRPMVSTKNYESFNGLVTFKGFTYKLLQDPKFLDDEIALNGLARTTLNLKEGSTIEVSKAFHCNTTICGLTIEISFLNATYSRNNVYKTSYFEDLFRKLDSWILTCNQEFVLVDPVKDIKFKCKIVKIESNLVDKVFEVNKGIYKIDKLKVLEITSPMIYGHVVSLAESNEQVFKVKEIDLTELGIGGIDKQFSDMIRLVFSSRLIHPRLAAELDIKHKKGLILYGPPGSGKTLLARCIGKMLNTVEPIIVNGPELLNKYVGQSEENIRKLFQAAEREWIDKGHNSRLHMIIFDEFDALAKSRSSNSESGTGDVSNNVVNQLLSKIDGVNSINNILLIGITNRLDLLDSAILRPGRFGVHIEIALPNGDGRKQIFEIHMKASQKCNFLSNGINVQELVELTENYTGAEIECIVQNAVSTAMMRQIDIKNLNTKITELKTKITHEDLLNAIREVRPAFGSSVSEFADISSTLMYSSAYATLISKLKKSVDQLRSSTRINLVTILLEGRIGSGKSTVASKIALESSCKFAKCISSKTLLSKYYESQKSSYINQVFNDAYKSSESVIVLDDIERLLEYVPIGPRFSNVLLQTIVTLISTNPPKDKKLLVIGTTSNPEVLRRMNLYNLFTIHAQVPTIERDNIVSVMRLLNPAINIQQDSTSPLPKEIPIKNLLMIVDQIANDSDINDCFADFMENVLTFE